MRISLHIAHTHTRRASAHRKHDQHNNNMCTRRTGRAHSKSVCASAIIEQKTTNTSIILLKRELSGGTHTTTAPHRSLCLLYALRHAPGAGGACTMDVGQNAVRAHRTPAMRPRAHGERLTGGGAQHSMRADAFTELYMHVPWCGVNINVLDTHTLLHAPLSTPY